MIIGNYLSFLSFFGEAVDFVVSLLVFVIVLSVIVGIHELGHFFFARRANILCREYAIGMGPRLWKKRKGETIYSIRAFPLGGFCAIAGEEVEADPFKDKESLRLDIVDGVIKGFYLDVDYKGFEKYPLYKIGAYDIYDENDTGNLFMEVEVDGNLVRYPVDSKAICYIKNDEMQIAPHNRTLGAKKKGQRALVMFGGPLFNFLLAIVVYFIVGLCTGFADMNSNEISDVTMGDIAYQYGTQINISDIDKYKDENVIRIYSESIQSKEFNNIESWSKVEDFVKLYNEKNLNEPVVIIRARDNYLTKGDLITSLESATLGNSGEITDFYGIAEFLDKYNSKGLAEKITINFTREGKAMSVEGLPFISVNNMGFGSGWYYDQTEAPVIKVLDDTFTSSSRGLGDNSQLKLGDKIIKITYMNNTVENPTWTDVRNVANSFIGNDENEDNNWISMVVERKTFENDTEVVKQETIKVKPYSKDLIENQTALDGGKPQATFATIDLNYTTKFSLIKSIGSAFTRTGSAFVAVFQTLKLLFNNTVSIKNLSGPIGIFSITSQALDAGFIYILNLIGFLSVNIGMLNLFPIPALDGGRLLFLGYEAVTKKKPNQKVETILITVTFILLMALMVVVAYEDIKSLLF